MPCLDNPWAGQVASLAHRVHALLVDDRVLHRDGLDVELPALRLELLLDGLGLCPEGSLAPHPTPAPSSRLQATEKK